MKNVQLQYTLIVSLVLGSVLTGCKNRDTDRRPPEIAVTNSYLYCVVKDICQSQKSILCLTPPGMCPGHFDISPAQINQLCKCRVLLLFDFQSSFEDSLQRIKEKGLKVSSVPALPGLCVPETYLATCREVCNILSLEYPEEQVQYGQSLKQIERRLENLADELLGKIKQTGLESAEVLVSDHQSQFCDWLGLETIATFVSGDVETVFNIDQCLKKAKDKDVRFVIANKQEGTGLADALAERLGAKVVVFSNFPNLGSGQNSFDMLVRQNVQAFLEAAK